MLAHRRLVLAALLAATLVGLAAADAAADSTEKPDDQSGTMANPPGRASAGQLEVRALTGASVVAV